MINLKVAPTASTSISWRDEVSYSYDVRSEGLERLKEAIRLAGSSDSASESPINETGQQIDTRVQSKACGA